MHYFVMIKNAKPVYIALTSLALVFNCKVIGVYGQPRFQDTVYTKWGVGLSYWHAFTFSGYTQVGENQYTGDKLSLVKDLGMSKLIYPELNLVHHISNASSFTFSAGRFFFSGHNNPGRNIFYNGALLKGADGVSIDLTNFYRITLGFEKSFRSSSGFYPVLLAGLVYDALNFHVNGTILPGYGQEDHEDFVTQSLPYPFIGGRLNKSLSSRSYLSVEATGTYIPLFKSFFYEGGQMSLHYATANCSLQYWYKQKRFKIGVGYLWRWMKQYEYSKEDDPNDFFLKASGLQLSGRYEL